MTVIYPNKNEDLGPSSIEKKGFIRSFFSQLAIMLRCNTILQLRNSHVTITQAILAPFILQMLLFILQQADYANQRRSNPHPPLGSLQGVQRCQGRHSGGPCVSVMYTPDATVNGVSYTQIMQTFAELNQPRTGYSLKIESPITDYMVAPTKIYDIVSVSDDDFIYNYIVRNPNSTAWAISFSQPVISTPVNIQYQLWINSTTTSNGTDIYGREVIAFVRGIDEAIITVLNDPAATIKANIDISIVLEKELKLRYIMEAMGLRPSVYWLSHFILYSVLVLINALCTCVWGMIFGFQAFRNTNFGVLLITFFLFGEAMVLFAFFITTLVRKTRVAILIGIFIFIIGILFESFIFSNTLLDTCGGHPKA
ncbi:hypothetical protein BASA62_002888 [Batrachochytrium salamandrivorans]|nr:hypothetical protein BASA62_002888 [Batrachochytrium salamandrivorans]